MLDELLQGNFLEAYLIPWSIKIITAILIFVIGRSIARLLVNLSRKAMLKGKLGTILFALLLTIVVLASLEQLGVKTTSALAILGAAGLAVGLSLQSSLSNFAAVSS